MLNLRIIRGPLDAAQEQTIVGEFNRLTNSAIPVTDFRRWVRDSPDGPAWHALLVTDESEIAGHFCLIPLHANYEGQKIRSARTEYFFVHEKFRKEKVRGFEDSFMPCGLLLLDRLYRSCRDQGWGPFIVSAGDEIRRFHEAVGCRPTDFQLSECLLTFRPWGAARRTPNLSRSQRSALFCSGLAQRAWWSTASIFRNGSSGITTIPAKSVQTAPGRTGIEFFEHKDSLQWRYPDAQYVAVTSRADPGRYVIAKHGSDARYLRVCQWHLDGRNDIRPFLLALIDIAKEGKALGVRWSVYQSPESSGLVNALRHLGFLCVRRNRRLLLYTDEPAYLKPEKWNITDSFFSFDL